MELKLDSKFFDKYFSKIELGLRPADRAEDEESLASAVGKMWAKDLEIAAAEELWLSPLISSTLPRTAVVERNELSTPNMGDILYISRVGSLVAEGNLGKDHSLKDDEENLDLSQVAFRPSRVGNAVAFRTKAAHSVSFDLKAAIKVLLADWAASKLEKLLISACESCSAANTIYAGVATSKAGITQTDVIQGTDLLRLSTLLQNSGAKGVSQLKGYYGLIVHPFQWLSLMMDPIFVNLVAQSSQKITFDIDGFVGAYAHFAIFSSLNVHSQLNAASPGTRVYSAYAFGARFAGIAWQKKWSWLKKGSSGDYGETDGIGTDAWVKYGPFRRQRRLKNRGNLEKPKLLQRGKAILSGAAILIKRNVQRLAYRHSFSSRQLLMIQS